MKRKQLLALLVLLILPFITGCFDKDSSPLSLTTSLDETALVQLNEQALQTEALDQLENEQELLKSLVISSGILQKGSAGKMSNKTEYFAVGLKSVVIDKETMRGTVIFEFIYDHPTNGELEGEIVFHFRNENVKLVCRCLTIDTFIFLCSTSCFFQECLCFRIQYLVS